VKLCLWPPCAPPRYGAHVTEMIVKAHTTTSEGLCPLPVSSMHPSTELTLGGLGQWLHRCPMVSQLLQVMGPLGAGACIVLVKGEGGVLEPCLRGPCLPHTWHRG
jgi:hypothetical protein